MCGIVGIASGYFNGLSGKEATIFQDMLFLDTLRGWDSTGVFGVDKHSNVKIHKAAMPGPSFICTKEFDTFQKDLIKDGLFAVGHNRAATRGEITDENAHPFWVDDKIVLVHNGSYKGCHKSLKDTAVDSEAIAHTISENTNLADALRKINAAYALVWYNTEEHTLNFVRNDERPLWFIESSTGALLWASEKETLHYVLARNDVKYKEPAQQLVAGTHVKLKIGTNGWEKSEEVLKNARYLWQSSDAPVFPPDSGRGRYYGEDWDTSTSHVTREIGYSNKNGPNDIKGTLAEIIMDRTVHKHIPFNQSRKIELALNSYREKNNGTFTIESLEYEPANGHKECQTWHVYGKISSTDPYGLLSGAVVHWFVFNKTEMEVLDYCSDVMYSVRITTVISRTYMKQGEQYGLVTAFATDVKPLVFNF
jgi:Glutamine amidotransferase domain